MKNALATLQAVIVTALTFAACGFIFAASMLPHFGQLWAVLMAAGCVSGLLAYVAGRGTWKQPKSGTAKRRAARRARNADKEFLRLIGANKANRVAAISRAARHCQHAHAISRKNFSL